MEPFTISLDLDLEDALVASTLLRATAVRLPKTAAAVAALAINISNVLDVAIIEELQKQKPDA